MILKLSPYLSLNPHPKCLLNCLPDFCDPPLLGGDGLDLALDVPVAALHRQGAQVLSTVEEMVNHELTSMLLVQLGLSVYVDVIVTVGTH